MYISILLLVPGTILIAILWCKGIEYMHKNHPEYKGEDLFDEEDEINIR
jgi:hypothetical protein